MKRKNSKKITRTKKRIRRSTVSKKKNACPKCGSKMIGGVCTKCNYSSKTAYRSRREAKEYTFAGD